MAGCRGPSTMRWMSAIPSPETSLNSGDIAWARDLAAAMITTALAVATHDNTEAEPIYGAARSQALSVRTDDGLGAERWLAAMFFISAHAASMLRQLARHESATPPELWQNLLLSRLDKPSA